LIGAAVYSAVALWLLLAWLLDGSHSRAMAEAVGTWLPLSGTNLFVLTLLSLYVLRLTSIQPLCKLTKRWFPSAASSSAVLGSGLLWLMLAAGLFPVLASESFRSELRWVALVLTPAVVSIALAELCPKSLQAASLAHHEMHGPFKSRLLGGFGRHTASQVAEAIGSLPLVVVAAIAVLSHLALDQWHASRARLHSSGASGFRLERHGFDRFSVEPFNEVAGSLITYRYVDFEGDRYEAGPYLSVIARKGAALASERWVVRKTLIGVSRQREIRSIRLTLLDHQSGDVRASRIFDVRDEKQILKFLPDLFGTPREHTRWKRIEKAEALQFEREVSAGSMLGRSALSIDGHGDGCQSVRMRRAPALTVLDMPSWQIRPNAILDPDFACDDRFVVFISWAHGTALVTVLSMDGREVFGFDLKTSRNWQSWGVTLGQVSVDSEEVRFVLQEWDAVKSADGSPVRVPTRRLAYRIPRASTQPLAN
jgi:hypothetical protein